MLSDHEIAGLMRHGLLLFSGSLAALVVGLWALVIGPLYGDTGFWVRRGDCAIPQA